MSANSEDVYDVVIVGGGVVGLSILRSIVTDRTSDHRSLRICLVEQEEDLLHWASGSNSGIVCTGTDAHIPTLERALLRDSIAQLRPYCQAMNVPLRPCGSIICQWKNDTSEDGGGERTERDPLQAVLREQHDAGDVDAKLLSREQVKEMEPNMNHANVLSAVHVPGEIVLDPWLYSISLAVHARENLPPNGSAIYVDFQVDMQSSRYDEIADIWVIRNTKEADGKDCPNILKSRVVISATGLWADELERHMLHRSSNDRAKGRFVCKPRRGQYRIYSSSPETTKIVHPIQPVPTQRTKGIFVFSTMYDQIVVGPTALDQTSKTDRTIDDEVSHQLADYARFVVPQLDVQKDYVDDYVGLRPGTDKRDYQIHVDYPRRWITCAGIRSTGLSASLGIGRHVNHLLRCGLLPSISSSQARTVSASQEEITVRTTPLPPLSELLKDFGERGDGKVSINGHLYKVTHPITKNGWKLLTKNSPS